jgi:hypothetical protein
METHKGIGIVPMTTWHVMPVDDCYVSTRLGQKLIGERHAEGATTDDQVVRRQHSSFSP